MDVEFNLQQFLSEMRKEQRDEMKELRGEVRMALDKVDSQEDRIVVLEGTAKSVRWLSRTMIVAFFASAFEFVFTHMRK